VPPPLRLGLGVSGRPGGGVDGTKTEDDADGPQGYDARVTRGEVYVPCSGDMMTPGALRITTAH
jgi:hypothetical protein